ncbi:MAG: SagB family peptide dehydrogenase [Acidimicrobiales bacterium]
MSAAVPTIWTFHEQTKHGGPGRDRSRLRPFRALAPETRPAPFKRYPGRSPSPLPTDVGTSAAPAVDALSGRGETEDPELDDRLLGRLLHHSAGVTRVTSSASGQTWFRASMSAGNLHPVEVYVVCGELPGVGAGVYHFAPLDFGLALLRPGDHRPFLAGAAADTELANSPASLVLTGIPWRTAWKYGERGLRHLYWDAGAMLANLLAVAEAAGLPARVRTAFVDDGVRHLVGIDARTELPLAVVTLGTGPPAAAGTASPPDVATLDLPAEPLPAGTVEFPLLAEAQAAGELADAESVTRWRRAASGHPATPASSAPTPPPGAGDDPVEMVVLRRGSTRLMRHETVGEQVLAWGTAVATRAVPGDWSPPGTTWLEHGLSVHAVDGTAPGAYRWRGEKLELLRAGELRDQAAHLCLDQPLGGDSAYTAFHLADLGPLVDVLGARAYRCAQLEAGIAAGRLALAAFALGCGATGLTFYDDEVPPTFATTAACLLVTSVGVPAYRSAPGGPPGQMTELRSFDDLMLRLSKQLGK